MNSVENIQIADVGAVSVALATFFGFLPNIAALLSVIWLMLRIWEMDTVKEWTGRSPKVTNADKVMKETLNTATKEKDDDE